MKHATQTRAVRLLGLAALALLLAGQPLLAPRPAAASEQERPASCCGCKSGCAMPCGRTCGASGDPLPREEKAPAPSNSTRDLGERADACALEDGGLQPPPQASRATRHAAGPPGRPASSVLLKAALLC